MFRKKNSILFVRPDYHCSFIYKENFRKLGWKADIYVQGDYPKDLLFSVKDVLRAPSVKTNNSRIKIKFNLIIEFLWWFTIFWKYKYHIYYSFTPLSLFIEKKLRITNLFGESFLFELSLAKILGIKLIYLPTGCHQEETKANWLKIEDGNVCNNCGMFEKCDDEMNSLNFDRVRRYFDTVLGPGSIKSTQFNRSDIKWKAIDLELWSPNIFIPKEHILPKTSNVRILHSSYIKNSGRGISGRDIKGSKYVFAAVERLKKEGYPVEYLFIEDKPSNQMRFYQAQADIVVEQLIYGSWGSTGVETMSLGKPVICYISKHFKKIFFDAFKEYSDLPIIEANTTNIYEVLKKVVNDKEYRSKKGIESRQFAEKHFNPVKNSQELIYMLKSL